VSKEQTTSEQKDREKRESIRSDAVSIELTWDELDEVAKKVGVENGKVLYALLANPTAMAQVDDYVGCVAECKRMLGDNTEGLVACINGCATVSKTDIKTPEIRETL
jgi:hypothetical protein